MNTVQTNVSNNTIRYSHGEFSEMLQQEINLMHNEIEKVLMINVALFLPDSINKFDERVLINFANNFQTFIKADDKTGNKKGNAHLLWLKSKKSCQLTILLNRADYPGINNHSANMGKLNASIKQSWASALGCGVKALFEKVRYPINPIHVLAINHCS